MTEIISRREFELGSKIKRMRILVMVTHSLSELDIVLPIFLKIASLAKLEITLVFTVRSIYRNYCKNEFYKKSFKKLGIKTIFLLMPNKFDDLFRNIKKNKVVSAGFRVLSPLMSAIQSIRILNYLYFSDVYMHEVTNQKTATLCLYLMSRLFRQKVYVYHHGFGLKLNRHVNRKVRFRPPAKFLLFYPESREYFKKIGYKNQLFIGCPIFYSEWKDFLTRYFDPLHEKESCVLILSKPLYQLHICEKEYITMHAQVLRLVRKHFPKNRILLKPHPRQSDELMIRAIEESSLNNVSITNMNVSALSMRSFLCISMYTSGVLHTLAFGVPSVEFFVGSQYHNNILINGTDYEQIGVPSVSKISDLEKYIKDVKNGKYRLPQFVNKTKKLGSGSIGYFFHDIA